MSSKTQLNDYVKRLKKQACDLSSEKEKLIYEVKVLKYQNKLRSEIIEELKKNQRKWYHFF